MWVTASRRGVASSACAAMPRPRPVASAAGIGSAPSARPNPPIARASAALRGPRVARRSRRHSERRAISLRARGSDDAGAEQVVEMDHPRWPAAALGQDEEGGDRVPLHDRDRLGRERAATDRLGRGRHQVARAQRAEIDGPLELAPQVAVGDDPDQLAGAVHHPGHAEPLGGHLDQRVRERRALGYERHLAPAVHELFDAQQAAAERAGGMEEREVLGREAALLEQRDGERVAERHGRGRAGRGRETEGAGLLRHAHVEDDVRAAREGRVEVAAEGDEREAQAARHRQEAQHLGALAAVRDREQQVAADERAQVAVAALAGVQEEGGRAGRGERGGDLPAHDAGLADAADDHPPAAGEQQLDGAREAPVEAVAQRRQGAPLDVEHAPRAREPRFGGHRRRALPRSARSMATSSPRSAGRSASGTLVAPSESARLGSSCTSMKTASAPAATAARASGATNLRSPPDAVPSPPGCCTLCVASNTTGQPVAARIGSERRSATRLLYPNAKPLSVTSRSWLPVERAFSTTRSISPGERNCPFFRFTGFPAAATATMKSVCRQRKAGVCSTSTTAATAATCAFSCASVSTGSPVSRRTSARMARPSSMPTPRKPSSEVRFALSKEDLYTTGSPARAAISRTRSAWRRAASRDSMTHGPAIRASGAPPPTVTVPTRTPRATSASPPLSRPAAAPRAGGRGSGGPP